MELAETQSASRPARGDMPARKDQRSAVTNGRRLHVVAPPVGGKWARRFRDILAEVLSDLGGRDSGLSEAQRQLARRCATICIACERLEGEAAAGNEINLEVYGTLTDRLGRCFQRLGLKRQARDVTLPLRDRWAMEFAAEAAAGAVPGDGEAAP